MTLITAIVAGLACGYFLGFAQKGFLVFTGIWLLVLLFQSFVALDKEDVPPEAWEYVPVQIVIFAIGTLMLRLGAYARTRLGRASA